MKGKRWTNSVLLSLILLGFQLVWSAPIGNSSQTGTGESSVSQGSQDGEFIVNHTHPRAHIDAVLQPTSQRINEETNSPSVDHNLPVNREQTSPQIPRKLHARSTQSLNNTIQPAPSLVPGLSPEPDPQILSLETGESGLAPTKGDASSSGPGVQGTVRSATVDHDTSFNVSHTDEDFYNETRFNVTVNRNTSQTLYMESELKETARNSNQPEQGESKNFFKWFDEIFPGGEFALKTIIGILCGLLLMILLTILLITLRSRIRSERKRRQSFIEQLVLDKEYRSDCIKMDPSLITHDRQVVKGVDGDYCYWHPDMMHKSPTEQVVNWHILAKRMHLDKLAPLRRIVPERFFQWLGQKSNTPASPLEPGSNPVVVPVSAEVLTPTSRSHVSNIYEDQPFVLEKRRSHHSRSGRRSSWKIA